MTKKRTVMGKRARSSSVGGRRAKVYLEQ